MEIKKIPYESTWPIRHQVMWPDMPYDFVKLPEDEQGLHYGLFVADELVAIVSAFVTEREAQFRKFATLESQQGKGYGTTLLRYLFEELSQQGITKIWCNARTEKSAFYERFEMSKTEKTYVKGGVDFVIMEKKEL